MSGFPWRERGRVARGLHGAEFEMTRGGMERGGLVGRRSRVEEKGLRGGYDGTPTQAPPFSSSLSSLPRASSVLVYTATDNYALIVHPSPTLLPLPPSAVRILLSVHIRVRVRINPLVSSPSRFSRFYVPSRRFRTSVTHNGTSGVNSCFFVVALVARNRRRLCPRPPTSPPPILRFFASTPPLLSSPLLFSLLLSSRSS